jgi:hypothetical protein
MTDQTELKKSTTTTFNNNVWCIRSLQATTQCHGQLSRGVSSDFNAKSNQVIAVLYIKDLLPGWGLQE